MMAPDSDDDANAENSAKEEYPNTEGEPLVCPNCGEHVAVIYRPQSEYPPRSSGFSIECDCAMGPQIEYETVGMFHPPWYLDRVQETEDEPEEWVRFYLDDRRDPSHWLDGDGDE